MKRILVTGALGQIGSELTIELREKYGKENVVAADIQKPDAAFEESGPFRVLDVLIPEAIQCAIKDFEIDTIFHLAAILSANGEKRPEFCWNTNMGGTMNILELSVKNNIEKVILPSSMAVWGKGVERENTPQESILKPTSMYGITKVAGELLCDYYYSKFDLDCRGLRYPGIISYETLPGGGTTDYAVEIFYEAIKKEHYNCFLTEDTMLPMMYMPDCLNATISLAEANIGKLKHHGDFNVAAFSFTPKQLAEAIKKYIPDFTIEYNPDYRQEIADSWPRTIDDSAARKEWGWKPQYDIDSMTKDMIEKLSAKL